MSSARRPRRAQSARQGPSCTSTAAMRLATRSRLGTRTPEPAPKSSTLSPGSSPASSRATSRRRQKTQRTSGFGWQYDGTAVSSRSAGESSETAATRRARGTRTALTSVLGHGAASQEAEQRRGADDVKRHRQGHDRGESGGHGEDGGEHGAHDRREAIHAPSPGDHGLGLGSQAGDHPHPERQEATQAEAERRKRRDRQGRAQRERAATEAAREGRQTYLVGEDERGDGPKQEE